MVRRSTGDLVLVDQQTLAAKCRVKLPGVEHIAASPASPLVFAPTDRKLRIVDLQAASGFEQELETGERITHPEVAPNGKYFFCAGEFRSRCGSLPSAAEGPSPWEGLPAAPTCSTLT